LFFIDKQNNDLYNKKLKKEMPMKKPLEKWVEQQAELTKPDRIHWCDGSEEEARKIVEWGINKEKINGTPVFQKLNQETYPNCFYHRSHPTDVARTEHLTFVCHTNKNAVGPNNNWMDPAEAKAKLTKLSDGCMKGKTMYVLPYMMGHPDSPYSKACVQLTDISYVAISMRIMTRLGKHVLEKIGDTENFVKGLHSVGDFDTDKRFVMHFPGKFGLEHRQRIRRQCITRQKMCRLKNSIGIRTKRRLVG